MLLTQIQIFFVYWFVWCPFNVFESALLLTTTMLWFRWFIGITRTNEIRQIQHHSWNVPNTQTFNSIGALIQINVEQKPKTWPSFVNYLQTVISLTSYSSFEWENKSICKYSVEFAVDIINEIDLCRFVNSKHSNTYTADEFKYVLHLNSNFNKILRNIHVVKTNCWWTLFTWKNDWNLILTVRRKCMPGLHHECNPDAVQISKRDTHILIIFLELTHNT